MDDEELPDDKTLEYDDETLELTLPSGDGTKLSDTCRNKVNLEFGNSQQQDL